MADVVSSITSLFSTVLQGFDYIQVARSFEDDVGLYQSQLAIIQLRLSRWGEAVGINPEHQDGLGEGASANAQTSLAINTDLDAVDDILHSIKTALNKAKKESAKWKLAASDDMGLDDDDNDDLKPRYRRLKSKIRQIVTKRCLQVSAGLDGAKWALYKKEQCEALTTKLLELIEQLEKVVDPESALDELSHKESEAIGESLKTLLEAVGECDPRLKAAASEQLEDQVSGTKITMSATTNYGLQLGINRGEIRGLSFGTGNTVTNHWHDPGKASRG